MDQIIAAEVAQAQGTRHHFHSLGSGAYMTSLSTVEDYDGAVNHLASAHHRSALEAAHALDMGVLASGQTANVLFTEKAPQRMQDAFPLGRVPRALQPLAYGATEEALASSPDAHVAKLWNRSFLSTNSGAYSTRPWGVLWSPFASADVVRSALAIHPSLLADHRFYLTWLAQKSQSARPRVGAVPGPTCAGFNIQPRCLASHVAGEDPKEAAMAFGAIDVACGPLACPHPGSQSLV